MSLSGVRDRCFKRLRFGVSSHLTEIHGYNKLYVHPKSTYKNFQIIQQKYSWGIGGLQIGGGTPTPSEFGTGKSSKGLFVPYGD